MSRNLLLRAVALAVALGLIGCAATAPPVGGTPYGLEERSHGHP